MTYRIEHQGDEEDGTAMTDTFTLPLTGAQLPKSFERTWAIAHLMGSSDFKAAHEVRDRLAVIIACRAVGTADYGDPGTSTWADEQLHEWFAAAGREVSAQVQKIEAGR